MGIENVKIRIDLDDLEKLSKVLNRSVDWLLDAELEGGGKECLYLVWSDSSPCLKLYQRATSKRMAFMIYDRKFKECHVAYSSGRERHFVQLVGVPVSTADNMKGNIEDEGVKLYDMSYYELPMSKIGSDSDGNSGNVEGNAETKDDTVNSVNDAADDGGRTLRRNNH